MSKSGKLKKQLKSAQRRRQRRPASTASVSPPVSASGSELQPSVDIAGIISEAILITAGKRGNLRDSAVLAALKALKGISKANSEAAVELLDTMESKLDQNQVSSRERHAAANEMLKLAENSIDPNVPDQMIRFLSLLDV